MDQQLMEQNKETGRDEQVINNKSNNSNINMNDVNTNKPGEQSNPSIATPNVNCPNILDSGTSGPKFDSSNNHLNNNHLRSKSTNIHLNHYLNTTCLSNLTERSQSNPIQNNASNDGENSEVDHSDDGDDQDTDDEDEIIDADGNDDDDDIMDNRSRAGLDDSIISSENLNNSQSNQQQRPAPRFFSSKGTTCLQQNNFTPQLPLNSLMIPSNIQTHQPQQQLATKHQHQQPLSHPLQVPKQSANHNHYEQEPRDYSTESTYFSQSFSSTSSSSQPANQTAFQQQTPTETREQSTDSNNLFHHPDVRNFSASLQYESSSAFRQPATGVDSLIMAAMMEERAAALAAATSAANYYHHHNYPTGRGLAYYNRGEPTSAFATSSLEHSNDDGTTTSTATYTELPSFNSHIPAPTNKSELELLLLLQSANLTSYFGTFLNFGGDDVQQLSEADEEEFLEIMSLVGMTRKPLHVRRLQKALIKWRQFKKQPAKQVVPMDQN